MKKVCIYIFYESYSKKRGTTTKRYTMDTLFDNVDEALLYLKEKNSGAQVEYDAERKEGKIRQYNHNGVPNHRSFKFGNKHISSQIAHII